MLSRFLVRQKFEKYRSIQYQGVWKALIDHRDIQRKDKAKVHRFTQIMRKFILYHMWRRYAQNVRYEIQLKDKGRIDGAYILIKRFKNRLKGMDDVIRRVSDEKANVVDF